MSKGDDVVGNTILAPVSNQPALQSPPASESGPRIDGDRLTRERRRICGAMSQQRGNSGHESVPQQFVHLVGCRDLEAGARHRLRASRPR